MRKYLFIFSFNVSSLLVQAQQTLSPKQIVFFEEHQINISSYQFDNEETNLNVSKTLKHHKCHRTLGLVSIPISIGWLGYTAYIPTKKFIINRKNAELIPTTTNNTYFIISSSLFTVASSCLIATLLQKEKRNKHLKLINL